ncbi:RNA exonuclease 1 [Saguinus oedipus]|uniref:RNA exonuclease 1 n=1 Tax=Saguinus oedipus TaxID=9490 RepID=A0ABQ9UVU6_SAGOE|nr:RNA exonuclease 1 [Saguinus oedipus]
MVVDTDVHVVYNIFVKLDNVIMDYTIRFSGVTEADLADTSPGHCDLMLHYVQAVLLSMCSANTILIIHSLQSDLLALKVIHSTIVDTSVLFPQCLCLPCKWSLRNLMATTSDRYPGQCRLAKLQPGCRHLHAPGDLEGLRRCQDQVMMPALLLPTSPATLACP